MTEESDQSTEVPFSETHDPEEIGKNYLCATPFRLDDPAYNEIAIDQAKADEYNEFTYDVSPEARYTEPNPECRRYYLHYESYYEAEILFERYFPQERYAEATECLFRMRYILTTGKPPRDFLEHAKIRHLTPQVNMFDRWLLARFERDEARRRELAWEALYWCIEGALRTLSNHQCYDFKHFCRILGEFELLGEDNAEYLRHFKRFAMHASITYFCKLRDEGVEVIPFKERGLPTVDEVKAIYNAYAGTQPPL